MEFFKPGKSYDFMGDRGYWIALQPALGRRLALRRSRVAGPELRHRLQGRHRGRGRVHQARRRRARSATAVQQVGLRRARRRVRSTDPAQPEPLPHPRAGGQRLDDAQKARHPRSALLLGAEGELPDEQLPGERARHRGQVQPRRRQDLRPLRARAGPRRGQRSSSRSVAGRRAPRRREQPAGREPARPQGRDPAQVARATSSWTASARELGADTVPEHRAARGVGRPQGRQAAPRRGASRASPSPSCSSWPTSRSASTCASRRAACVALVHDAHGRARRVRRLHRRRSRSRPSPRCSPSSAIR